MKFQKPPKRLAEWGHVTTKTWEVTCITCGKCISGEYASMKKRQAAHERGHLRGHHQQYRRTGW